ncbi:MAG TPA: hypothetical protein PK987_08415 [Ferruginibacter sp.]|nr:hypothetical protein [Ferruginibacter sp.]
MDFSYKTALPLIITFIVIAVITLCANFFLGTTTIDFVIVMAANCLFFLISLFIFKIQFDAMYDKNPQVFIRRVMSSMLLKLFACVIAVVAYYFLSGSSFNKPAVYISMLIYIIYLVVEVGTIMKLNKSKDA